MASCIGCYGIRGVGLASQDSASARAAMLKRDKKAQWKAMLASKSERAAAQAQVNKLLAQARQEAAARYRAAGDIARAERAAAVQYRGTLEDLGRQVGLSGFRGIGSLGLEVDTKASLMTSPAYATAVAATSFDSMIAPVVAKQANAYISSALATLSPKEEWSNAIATTAGKEAMQTKIASLVETARSLAIKRYQAAGDYARLRGLRGLGDASAAGAAAGAAVNSATSQSSGWDWGKVGEYGSMIVSFFGKLIDNDTAQSNAQAQQAQAEAQRRAAEAQAAAQQAALQQAAILAAAAAEAEKQKKMKLIIGIGAGALVLGVGAFVFLK